MNKATPLTRPLPAARPLLPAEYRGYTISYSSRSKSVAGNGLKSLATIGVGHLGKGGKISRYLQLFNFRTVSHSGLREAVEKAMNFIDSLPHE